jgi:hypothetical protein
VEEDILAAGEGIAEEVGAAAEAGSEPSGDGAALQRVEVSEEVVELLWAESASGGGHHVTAVEDGLADEAFIGGQAARQEGVLEEALEARAVLAWNGVGVVASGAGLPVELAAVGLWGGKAERGVGFRGGVVVAAARE